MENIFMNKLEAKHRKVLGRKVKGLRKSGVIPAVLYGPKTKEPQCLEVNCEKFREVFKKSGESSLIKLKIDKEEKDVLVRDVQQDPMNGNFLHIDFYEVPMTEKITLTIPLKFIGESEAVKNLSGILVKNIFEIEIESLPKDIPSEVDVDITPLKTFEDAVKIRDINVPSGVKIMANPEEIVVLVSPPRTEEELKDLEEKVEEKVEEVQKVEKEKTAEEEGEATKE